MFRIRINTVLSCVRFAGTNRPGMVSRAAYSTGNDPYETQIYDKITAQLSPEFLTVKDVSGGCGSMFAITVVSKQFEGLTTIKQHRLVNEILKEDISKWHGLQLQTRIK